VTSTLEYRKWRTLSKATASAISLLNDLVQFANSASDDEEEEYEEVEDDVAFAEESKTEELGIATAQYIGLTQESEDLLDEV
jgi:hypothetical protein